MITKHFFTNFSFSFCTLMFLLFSLFLRFFLVVRVWCVCGGRWWRGVGWRVGTVWRRTAVGGRAVWTVRITATVRPYDRGRVTVGIRARSALTVRPVIKTKGRKKLNWTRNVTTPIYETVMKVKYPNVKWRTFVDLFFLMETGLPKKSPGPSLQLFVLTRR